MIVPQLKLRDTSCICCAASYRDEYTRTFPCPTPNIRKVKGRLHQATADQGRGTIKKVARIIDEFRHLIERVSSREETDK